GTPNGNVIFHIPGSPDVTVPLNGSGVATLAPPLNASATTYTITADYQGSGNYLVSSSDPIVQTVNKADANVAIATTNANAAYGEASITATVTAAAPGAGTPTG